MDRRVEGGYDKSARRKLSLCCGIDVLRCGYIAGSESVNSLMSESSGFYLLVLCPRGNSHLVGFTAALTP